MPTILWEKHLVTAHRVQRQCLIGLIEYTTSTTTKCKSFISYFCEMNFTFSQSFYIRQLLTIDYDCPVPVRQKNKRVHSVQNWTCIERGKLYMLYMLPVMHVFDCQLGIMRASVTGPNGTWGPLELQSYPQPHHGTQTIRLSGVA